MYLSRFGVKHYKCLGEIDIPLTPIHVIIGENDAGKTSLLEAMAALHASSETAINDVFPQPWDGKELVHRLSSQDIIPFAGEWDASPDSDFDGNVPCFSYAVSILFPSRGIDCEVSGEWLRTGKRTISVSAARNNMTALYATRQGKGLSESISSAHMDQLRKIPGEVVKSAQKYSLHPKTMAMPAAIDPRRKFRLDQDGFGLATLIGDVVDYKPELFIQLRDKFCEYFEQFSSVRLESTNALDRTSDSNGIWQSKKGVGKGIFFETRSGQTVRAQQASDGAILFLGILALAHLPDPPNLLLIEEPENGIYPKRLGEVITMLKELVTRTDGVRFPQIIMTTHSPYVLSFFDPEEVTFLSRPSDDPDGPVRARPLREAPNIKERLGDDFYLGELWYNLSEEELFGEP